MTRATVPATEADIPQDSKTGASSFASVAPPNAEARKPDRVTPIWTADRKRLGSDCSCWIERPRDPRVAANCLTWESRRLTSAISAAENTPPRRMNSRMMAAFSRTSATDLHHSSRHGGKDEGVGTIALPVIVVHRTKNKGSARQNSKEEVVRAKYCRSERPSSTTSRSPSQQRRKPPGPIADSWPTVSPPAEMPGTRAGETEPSH